MKDVASGTAMTTPRDSIEDMALNWARILSRGRCPRCNGFMVSEWCEDFPSYTGQRCVQCGELMDPIILHNRHMQRIRASDPDKGL